MSIGFTTLARLENGKAPDLVNVLVIADWLRLPLHWLASDEPLDTYRRGWDDCAATVRDALKGVES